MRIAILTVATLSIVISCARNARPTNVSPTSASIDQLLDSARKAGLPVGPLVNKVAEGYAKHASDSLILSVVRLEVQQEAQRKP